MVPLLHVGSFLTPHQQVRSYVPVVREQKGFEFRMYDKHVPVDGKVR